MRMDNQKLLNIMLGIKNDLKSAYTCYASNNKDTHIKAANGKIDVLIELLKK
jgi:hypothetical protein